MLSFADFSPGSIFIAVYFPKRAASATNKVFSKHLLFFLVFSVSSSSIPSKFADWVQKMAKPCVQHDN